MEEIWKPVKGHEDFYAVSNLGRIKSLPRIVQRWTTRQSSYAGRILTAKNGRVQLHHGDVSTRRRLDVLVAQAFLGKCPEGQELVHINGDQEDCRLSNLKYKFRTSRSKGRQYTERGISFFCNRFGT